MRRQALRKWENLIGAFRDLHYPAAWYAMNKEHRFHLDLQAEAVQT